MYLSNQANHKTPTGTGIQKTKDFSPTSLVIYTDITDIEDLPRQCAIDQRSAPQKLSSERVVIPQRIAAATEWIIASMNNAASIRQ